MQFASLKSRILLILASLWVRSLRIRLHTPADYRPGVLGLWHRDLLASTACFKNKDVHVLISESKDGEFFAKLVTKLGYKVTRGSDSHGALNVRHLLRTLKEDGFVGMALDGPRGPALEVKPGSYWLAETANRPLWLIEPHYGPHFSLKSWDKFIVPLPMTAIDIQIKYLSDVVEHSNLKGKQP